MRNDESRLPNTLLPEGRPSAHRLRFVAGLSGCADLLGIDSGAWPTFQADVANTDHLDETGPTEFADERWRVKTGLVVTSLPAVVDGTV